MLPSASCTPAIASIVDCTSARVRMPPTSGSASSGVKAALPPFRSVGWDFLAVEHDALAEHRIERAFRGCGPCRSMLDQHAQEVVIFLDRCRVGVVESVHAAQPPVGRMECVRVMRAAQEEAGALELQFEL